MPTGFLPNPVSTTRRPSGQTRWEKISFALARLRPSSEYADGLLTESRLDNPKAIGSNPMGENQLRPRSVDDRTRSMPTGFILNPVSPTRRPSRQTRWKKTNPKFQNHQCIYTIYDIYILIIGIIYKYKYAL